MEKCGQRFLGFSLRFYRPVKIWERLVQNIRNLQFWWQFLKASHLGFASMIIFFFLTVANAPTKTVATRRAPSAKLFTWSSQWKKLLAFPQNRRTMELSPAGTLPCIQSGIKFCFSKIKNLTRANPPGSGKLPGKYLQLPWSAPPEFFSPISHSVRRRIPTSGTYRSRIRDVDEV